MPPQPWNVYPIDDENNPLNTKGAVLAAHAAPRRACCISP